MFKRLCLFLIISLVSSVVASAQQTVTLPHNLPTFATSPLPNGSCFVVDQFVAAGNYIDTKLCSGWAKAFGGLTSTSNLSDLSDVNAAWTNLGGGALGKLPLPSAAPLLGSSGNGFTGISIGSNLSLVNNVLSATGGGGGSGTGLSSNGQLLYNQNGIVNGYTLGGVFTAPGNVLTITPNGITNPLLAAGTASQNIGTLGGVLTGQLPNPDLATGVASSNVGVLGGVLIGSLPNPGLAPGIASSNVGNLSGALVGILPNPALAPGVAAQNIGAVGGSLRGTMPNPQLAAGVAATNVGTLSGDLIGTLPSPSVASIRGIAVSTTPPTDGQSLIYSASAGQYTPQITVSGINQLTGDVTAGPGTGSQSAVLAATGVPAGAYTLSDGSNPHCWNVDGKGRITSITNGICTATHFVLLEAGGFALLEAGGKALCESC